MVTISLRAMNVIENEIKMIKTVIGERTKDKRKGNENENENGRREEYERVKLWKGEVGEK